MDNLAKKNRFYSETFSREVVKLVESGQMSAYGASRHFGIGGSMTVYRWLKKYGTDRRASSITHSTMKESSPNSQPDQIDLLAEVESLKQLLSHERLRSEAYLQMIKLAESKYQIPIEKKSGPKQSKK